MAAVPSPISKFLSISPAERWFAVRAWLAAPAIEVALAVVGLPKTLAWVRRRAAKPRRRSRTAVDPAMGSRIVGGVYRVHMVRGKCLPRSVLQYALHLRDGVAARFVIGVRRGHSAPGAVEAHAWVDSGGPMSPDFEPLMIVHE